MIVSGSRKIQVLKRDGGAEPFDVYKLASVLWRATRQSGLSFERNRYLAEAVLFYLVRSKRRCASSAAIFEMAIKVFQHVRMADAAGRLQAHRAWRRAGRRAIVVRHDNDRLTCWDKGWLASLAQRSWHISRTTARIVAGQVELQLIQARTAEIAKSMVVEMLNDRMVAFGLADAVPVR